MQVHVVFWSSGISPLVLGILPMGFFPRTPSFTILSFVDAPSVRYGAPFLTNGAPRAGFNGILKKESSKSDQN